MYHVFDNVCLRSILGDIFLSVRQLVDFVEIISCVIDSKQSAQQDAIG